LTKEQALGALEEICNTLFNDNYHGLEEQIMIIKEYLEEED
jgi:hypothetical protein